MPSHLMIGNADAAYASTISHHQERAILQQQLQELYCMVVPNSEQQEKICRIQERLNLLQQHETTEQCNGGAQCILQSPLFSSAMIETPQVTSTTGRGRSKISGRQKKPRQKKDKDKSISSQIVHSPVPSQTLPVSEDCVTPGAGLTISQDEMGDGNDPGSDQYSFDFDSGDSKSKKSTRTVRKSRDSKKSKELDLDDNSITIKKERKKRDMKEMKDTKILTKRKYVRKKKLDSAEEADSESFDSSLVSYFLFENFKN